MMLPKHHSLLISILATTLAITPTTITSFAVPASLKHASIYAAQRAKFTKAMITTLYKHARGTAHTNTIIEAKLARVYISTECTPEQSAANLAQAIRNNKTLSNSKDFYIGASSSAFQVEGGLDETSASARFFRNKAHLPTPEDAIDFYHRYQSDIQQLKEELNINAFRISLAWNRIEPQQCTFDSQAIKFYRNVIRELVAQGIKPMVVFHHYDAPIWFEDLGGFTLQSNGKLFQQFCLHVYTQLAPELGDCLISMCNAPEGPAFKGYFTGDGTPGEKDNLQKTHTVIANMYYELVDTALNIKKLYRRLKRSNPELKQPSIGTQINVIPLDPHCGSQTD